MMTRDDVVLEKEHRAEEKVIPFCGNLHRTSENCFHKTPTTEKVFHVSEFLHESFDLDERGDEAGTVAEQKVLIGCVSSLSLALSVCSLVSSLLQLTVK